VTRIEEIKKIFASLKLPSSTLWHELESQDQLQKNETFKHSENLEKLTAFEDYMRELERLEQQKEKLKTKRQERKNREQFKDLLVQKQRERKINARSKWSEFLPSIKHEPTLRQMLGQPGSKAREIFDDFVKEEKEVLKKYKDDFKKLIKVSSFQL